MSPEIVQREILRVLQNNAGVFARDGFCLEPRVDTHKLVEKFNTLNPLVIVSEVEPKNIYTFESSGEENAV